MADHTSLKYRELADGERARAAETKLANIREQSLRSAHMFDQMAQRAERFRDGRK